MVTSILHRFSGVYMALGLVAFAAWLLAAADGLDAYREFVETAASFPGQVLLFGWLAAFFYHLANGIRHLAWDLGYGFELRTANASAWFVIVLAAVLTLAFWVAL